MVWQSSDANSYGIYSRTYDANGANPSVVTAVNAITAGSQEQPSVAALGTSGNFVVVWNEAGKAYFNIYNSGLNSVLVDENNFVSGVTDDSGTPVNPLARVAGLSNGNFVATWVVGNHDAVRRLMPLTH
ncbi:hypothetical protein MCP1_1150001 [Candidatus Terasakiella magnetica]|nr:hypothetical protein MCP1_1150001 [Candidatus Terasakiella magnetica]